VKLKLIAHTATIIEDMMIMDITKKSPVLYLLVTKALELGPLSAANYLWRRQADIPANEPDVVRALDVLDDAGKRMREEIIENHLTGTDERLLEVLAYFEEIFADMERKSAR
jgi:hypothetical protein